MTEIEPRNPEDSRTQEPGGLENPGTRRTLEPRNPENFEPRNLEILEPRSPEILRGTFTYDYDI